MKKSLAKYFACYQNIDVDKVTEIEEPQVVLDDSQLKRVLDEIFSVDPISGLPRGDVAYFLSPEGNPQVKAWLEQNLLQPRAKNTGSSIEGVTDDMIVEMSRKSDETVEHYTSRLTSLYDSAKAEYDKNIQMLNSKE